VASYSALVTAMILAIVNAFIPIRVAAPAEEVGLDLAQHGEVAYQP
jgi:ammonia channel protein AmtB